MRYAVLLLGALTLAIAQPEFSGHIVKPDTARFSIYTKSDPEIWKFDIPSDAYFWMKIDDENGRELADVRLQTSRYVKLVGGGKFSFRLYTVGGDGAWSAKKVSSADADAHVVTQTSGKASVPTTSSGHSTANPKSGGGFEGVIVKPDTARFSVTTQSNPETWKFEIPSDAYFWMKIDDENGRELADVRLQTSRYVKLVGGGKFSFRLYTVGGDGAWSAKRISGSGSEPHIVSKSANPSAGRSTANPKSGGGFEGVIVEPDTARFSVTTQSNPETWKFEIPSEAYFWMKIDDENGRELADVRLQTSRYVKLVGGGKFSFRLYTVGGDGAWSAKRISGSGSEPHIVSKSAVEEGERSGYLDEGESETFTVIAESDPEEWEFNWIGDGTFWVKVRNRDGVEIADLDLSEGNTIVLKGGGLFTLEIRAVEGGGFWSAERQ